VGIAVSVGVGADVFVAGGTVAVGGADVEVEIGAVVPPQALSANNTNARQIIKKQTVLVFILTTFAGIRRGSLLQRASINLC
jgi:hypothetical protein